MVTLNDIHKHITILADEKLAEKWDNVGIMLGDTNQKITKILVCLDVTTEVVKEAKEKKVNLIISHHPLIFKGITKLDFSNFKSNIIRELIKNDISVISAHTNLDSARLGLNDYLAKLLGLTDVKVLFENSISEDTGLGRIGNLAEELPIDAFIDLVKEKLDLKFTKLVGCSNKTIRSVAVLGGSGGSFIYNLPEVDIYLTGDIGYHEAIDAIEMNKTLLDIGHFAEKVSKNLLKEYLENLSISSNYEVLVSEVEKEPFEIR